MAKSLLPKHRIQICMCHLQRGRWDVEVTVNRDKQDAGFRGLQTCGCVWVCPVCAGRITEQRTADLLRATTKWHVEGGFVVLLTFTMQHGRYDTLEASLDALLSAYRRFTSGKGFQAIKEKYNWRGSIKALEVTHGINGWHPHLHVLAFFEPVHALVWKGKKGRQPTGFAVDVKKRWVAMLEAHGRAASFTHGLDVRDADTDVYEYIAKFGHLPESSTWTLEREMVKAPSKISTGRDGRSPFQLLADFVEGDLGAGRLFQEYAAVFAGRQQLHWSKGLRALLEMEEEELSDEEAAAQTDVGDETVYRIPVGMWREINMLERRGHWGLKGEILEAAFVGGAVAVEQLLRELGVAAA